jgi:hypothetical protein
LDAYTVTLADFIIPAIGANVQVSVQNALWMVAGQIVVAAGPANFRVVSVDSATTATLTFLGYANDLSPGVTISAGAGISPSGEVPELATQSVTAAGTAYQLTATSAFLNFGTTDPTVTVTAAGTYLVLARARLDYNGATFAAHRTITLKLRRTNNTPADLVSCAAGTDIITTLSYPAADLQTPPLIYTATAGDILQLWGDVSVVPTAGSLDATEATIVLVKLS